MNQTLIFENAWDRTIAEADREKIKDVFEQSRKHLNKTPIQFTALNNAINHKGELLVTVLIHNVSDKDFSFHEDSLQYIHSNTGKVIAEHSYTIPRLKIKKYTSMPWTFIFPIHHYELHKKFEGYLTFKNERK